MQNCSWSLWYQRDPTQVYNLQGMKVKNAKFKKVKLCGITLHRNMEVTGPTRSSLDELETPLGHLMLQGDHGPVAYLNIKLRKQ